MLHKGLYWPPMHDDALTNHDTRHEVEVEFRRHQEAFSPSIRFFLHAAHPFAHSVLCSYCSVVILLF